MQTFTGIKHEDLDRMLHNVVFYQICNGCIYMYEYMYNIQGQIYDIQKSDMGIMICDPSLYSMTIQTFL